jgi:excisionase family DNA binding protein
MGTPHTPLKGRMRYLPPEPRYNQSVTNAEVEFSFEDAVRTLGVTPERLERLIDEGKIQAKRQGIEVRIPRRSILEYMSTVSMVGKTRGKKAATPAEGA